MVGLPDTPWHFPWTQEAGTGPGLVGRPWVCRPPSSPPSSYLPVRFLPTAVPLPPHTHTQPSPHPPLGWTPGSLTGYPVLPTGLRPGYVAGAHSGCRWAGVVPGSLGPGLWEVRHWLSGPQGRAKGLGEAEDTHPTSVGGAGLAWHLVTRKWAGSSDGRGWPARVGLALLLYRDR